MTTINGPPIDSFGRRIEYARLSVTDRRDLRCRYRVAEKMQFLPRREVLTFPEIEQPADALIARGVRRIRLTGGEPLVRPDIEHAPTCCGCVAPMWLLRYIWGRVGRSAADTSY